jgi:hypothetical protein
MLSPIWKSQRKTPGESRGAVLRKRLTLAALLAGFLLPALLSALTGLLLLLARLLRAAALLARLALAALLLLARILLVRIVHNRSCLHLPRDRKRLRHRTDLFKSLPRGLMSRWNFASPRAFSLSLNSLISQAASVMLGSAPQ